jgi:hypothetical protein
MASVPEKAQGLTALARMISVSTRLLTGSPHLSLRLLSGRSPEAAECRWMFFIDVERDPDLEYRLPGGF